MARYKERHREQSLMVPIRLENQLQPGTFEHAIDYIIDNKMDLSCFDSRYRNDETGRPAWDPAVMLKIILFAYSRGITSSRKISQACEENIVFMALSDDSRPHFTTISDFVASLDGEVEPIFQQILLICSELDLIGGEMLAVDGCKLSSNAAKEWSGTQDQLAKKKEKIKKVVEKMIEQYRSRDKDDDDPNFGGRVKTLEGKIERIEKYLETAKPKIGKRGRELQQNITDPDSAKMMTSKGTIQGYNGLSMTDGKNQIVVYAEAFGKGQEHDLLEPMVKGTKKYLQAIGNKHAELKKTKLSADTNYHTESNCRYLEAEGIDGYVPDQQFRKRDSRFDSAIQHRPKRKRKYSERDFRYEEDRDKYICPDGKELSLEKRAGRTGDYIYRQYTAKEIDCRICTIRENCLTNEKTKKRRLAIPLEKLNSSASQRMKDKIDTDQGRKEYSRRMGIVEPVFGNITYAKGMRRITLRGKMKATVQWMLFNLVHNIEKISHKNYMEMAYG